MTGRSIATGFAFASAALALLSAVLWLAPAAAFPGDLPAVVFLPPVAAVAGFVLLGAGYASASPSRRAWTLAGGLALLAAGPVAAAGWTLAGLEDAFFGAADGPGAPGIPAGSAGGPAGNGSWVPMDAVKSEHAVEPWLRLAASVLTLAGAVTAAAGGLAWAALNDPRARAAVGAGFFVLAVAALLAVAGAAARLHFAFVERGYTPRDGGGDPALAAAVAAPLGLVHAVAAAGLWYGERRAKAEEPAA